MPPDRPSVRTDDLVVGTGNRDVALEYLAEWFAAALIAQVLVEIDADLDSLSQYRLRTPDGRVVEPRDDLHDLDADYVTLVYPAESTGAESNGNANANE